MAQGSLPRGPEESRVLTEHVLICNVWLKWFGPLIKGAMRMTQVVVIGVEGETDLWVADLKAGTVAPLHSPKAGTLKTVTDLRASGASVIKGVNVAVAVKTADAAFSGHYDG